MRLLDQTSGRIMFNGEEIGGILPNAFARLPLRKSIQMVFQDPTDSLNPRAEGPRRHCARDCAQSEVGHP
jgi:peptide/nickel transport system ATP-binding protein